MAICCQPISLTKSIITRAWKNHENNWLMSDEFTDETFNNIFWEEINVLWLKCHWSLFYPNQLVFGSSKGLTPCRRHPLLEPFRTQFNRSSTSILLTIQDKQFLVYNQERCQLPAPFRCWEIIEKANIFHVSQIYSSRHGLGLYLYIICGYRT